MTTTGPDGRTPPASVARRSVDEVLEGGGESSNGAAWVHLEGANRAAALMEAVRILVRAGARVAVEGLPEDVDAPLLLELSREGASQLRLRLPVSLGVDQVLRSAPQVGPRRVVVAPAEGAVQAVQAAATWSADVSIEGRGPDDGSVRAALDEALPLAAEADLDLRVTGVVLAPAVPAPVQGGPLLGGRAVLGAVRAGLLLPCFGRGVRQGPGWDAAAALFHDDTQLALLFARMGLELHGGAVAPIMPAATPFPAGGRVVVVLGPVSDRLAVATWPGLVDALRATGFEASLQSAWHAPFNTAGGAPVVSTAALDEVPAAKAHALSQVEAFARGLDLRAADVVIVAGLDWGELVSRHPSLPAHARLVVVDDHLGQGLSGWVKRHRRGTPGGVGLTWVLPHRTTFVSGFPRFSHLYALPGLPLAHVAYRPYPLDHRVLPVPVRVEVAEHVFAGGNHLRQHELLGEAVAMLPAGGRPVELISAGRPTVQPARLRVRPPLPLRAFVERIAASRFVVVPAAHSPDRSAGNSVIAIAHALGRPVVATATPAALDHVRHNADGWIVPHGDARALAEAIAWLDSDDAAVQRLAAGARASGARADVSAWAARLVGGVVGP